MKSNNQEETLVSVIIPTYKRADMLPRAIDSVLNQTYCNVQAIVVDDNDPASEYRTKTKNIMSSYAENLRVKYVCHDKNRNGSAARNTGIKNADGEIVAFLDDDDFYYPDKIRKQVEFLIEHREYQAVYCGWERDGEVVIPTHKGDLSYDILSGDHIIYTNVIMMWKDAAVACGGWDETFKRHQEAAFLLRYFRNGGKIGVVEEVLAGFDTSDRSNAASNAAMNEEQVLYYLESYKDMIIQCGMKEKNADKRIYSHRYRGIFLGYLKAKDFKGAFGFYRRKCIKMPLRFMFDMANYAFRYFGKKAGKFYVKR